MKEYIILFCVVCIIVIQVLNYTQKHGNKVSEKTNTEAYMKINVPVTLLNDIVDYDTYRIHEIPKSCDNVFPVTFSFPVSKIRAVITKEKLFASVIPGKLETYVFKEEDSYMKEYQQSEYGLTCKKGGWDCMRHLEIMGAGCIPCMDLKDCPKLTMFRYPKYLMQFMYNNHMLLNTETKKYVTSLFYRFLKEHLTCISMMKYVLEACNIIISPEDKILFLDSLIHKEVDYLSVMTYIGLKELFGKNVETQTFVPYIYNNFKHTTHKYYGMGFNYSKSISIDLCQEKFFHDSEIENRLKNRLYKCVIYGCHGHGLPYLELVRAHYEPTEIIIMKGDDTITFKEDVTMKEFVFVRELH